MADVDEEPELENPTGQEGSDLPSDADGLMALTKRRYSATTRSEKAGHRRRHLLLQAVYATALKLLTVEADEFKERLGKKATRERVFYHALLASVPHVERKGRRPDASRVNRALSVARDRNWRPNEFMGLIEEKEQVGPRKKIMRGEAKLIATARAEDVERRPDLHESKVEQATESLTDHCTMTAGIATVKHRSFNGRGRFALFLGWKDKAEESEYEIVELVNDDPEEVARLAKRHGRNTQPPLLPSKRLRNTKTGSMTTPDEGVARIEEAKAGGVP